MAYEMYAEHPESADRKAADFSAWSMWAAQNAPWTGVAVSEMASLLQAVCAVPTLADTCQTLDTGGSIPVGDARRVLALSGSQGMTEKVRAVFQHAVKNGYPVRVVFSKGFGSLTASAYLAKQSSA